MKHKLLLVIACVLSLAILLPACAVDTEREEIVSFTRQALEIEAKRNELMEFFASFRPPHYGYGFSLWLIDKGFLGGVPAKTYTFYSGDEVPPSSIEGMSSLRNRLLLLGCPQSTQSIKDALDQIYDSEIGLAESQSSQKDLPWIPYFGSGLVLCEVTKDNLSYWRQYDAKVVQSEWFKVQELRKDTYTRWAEILQEHGIDPVQEGFTELIRQ